MIKVIVINSVSFTGTTWLLSILGSAPGRLAVGNPNQITKRLPDQIDKICCIHGATCGFWPAFISTWKPDKNFYKQLAYAANVDTMIIRNPNKGKFYNDLQDPGLDVRYINLVRDGRALWASYRRKNPETENTLSALKDYLQPVMKQQVSQARDNTLTVRYEDLVENRERTFECIASHIELTIEEDAFRFWEFDHHIVSGNASTYGTIKFARGINKTILNNRLFYYDYIENALNGGSTLLKDYRWKSELSETELATFDFHFGVENERLGYKRDCYIQEAPPPQKKRLREDILETIHQYPPLSKLNQPDYYPSYEQKEKWKKRIRSLPYPFEAAIAVTSDTDGSNKSLYHLYIDQLVGEFGLDFGDSMWLENNRSGKFPGIGFFNASLTYDPSEVNQREEIELMPYEIADEYHKGNIDHWHSYLVYGPRIILLSNPQKIDSNVLLFTPPKQSQKTEEVFTPTLFPITAVSVLFPEKLASMPIKIRMAGECKKTGKELIREFTEIGTSDQFRFLNHTPENLLYYFFFCLHDVWETHTPIMAEELNHLEVFFEADNIGSENTYVVYLHNYHGELLLDRIDHVYHQFGISPNLLTGHGMWHFVHWYTITKMAEKNIEMVEKSSDVLMAFPFHLINNKVYFSTWGEDPRSFACLYPKLRERYGVHYMRLSGNDITPPTVDQSHELPHAAMSVYPVASRDGGAVFALRSSLWCVPDEEKDLTVDQKNYSRSDSFSYRLKQIMADLYRPDKNGNAANRALFFYTHVGNLYPATTPSNPYFDPNVLAEARNDHYGMEDMNVNHRRLWFTRATVLADYANLVSLMPELCTWDETGNVIHITSTEDALLDCTIPRNPHHLYGQTLYVNDASAARVFLSAIEIRDLQRNPKDQEGGRPSVTIVDCGIRRALFDEADPVTAFAAQGRKITTHQATWEWKTDNGQSAWSNAYGILTITDSISDNEIRCFMKNSKGILSWIKFDGCMSYLPAAQHLFFSVKKSHPHVSTGILFETDSKGLFFFGDRSLKECTAELTGSASNIAGPLDDKGWQRYVGSFFRMDWLNTHSEPTALPNHQITAFYLVVMGEPGEWVSFDQVTLGRPRTTRSPAGPHHAIVGGRLTERIKDIDVVLKPVCVPGTTDPVVRTTDGFGGFNFGTIPCGAWLLYRKDGQRDAGSVYEINSDRFDLMA